MKCAYAIIENQDLREKYLQRRLANNQQEISTLGMLATKVAYENGSEWLNELKNVLEKISLILSQNFIKKQKSK